MLAERCQLQESAEDQGEEGEEDWQLLVMVAAAEAELLVERSPWATEEAMTALLVMAKVEGEEELECCSLPAEEEAAVHGLPLVEEELAEHLAAVREERSQSAPLEAEAEGRRQESICRHRCLEEVVEEEPVRGLVEGVHVGL